jgi:hypothetical protein
MSDRVHVLCRYRHPSSATALPNSCELCPRQSHHKPCIRNSVLDHKQMHIAAH